MMWTYYAPVLRMQLWLWPLIAFGIYMLGLLTSLTPFPAISSFSISGLSLLIGFGPLILVRSNALIADTMLPARVDEKFLFFLIYFVFFLPLLVVFTVTVLHSLSCAALGPERLADLTAYLSMRVSAVTLTYGLGYFSEALSVLATLLGVTAFTRNRALAGVGLNIGCGIALGIIGAILGIIAALSGTFADFFEGFEQGLESATPADIDNMSAMQMELMLDGIYASPFMRMILNITVTVSIIGSIILGWLTYRAMRRRQL